MMKHCLIGVACAVLFASTAGAATTLLIEDNGFKYQIDHIGRTYDATNDVTNFHYEVDKKGYKFLDELSAMLGECLEEFNSAEPAGEYTVYDGEDNPAVDDGALPMSVNDDNSVKFTQDRLEEFTLQFDGDIPEGENTLFLWGRSEHGLVYDGEFFWNTSSFDFRRLQAGGFINGPDCNGGGVIIPTPSAAAMGLLLVGPLFLRRRA